LHYRVKHKTLKSVFALSILDDKELVKYGVIVCETLQRHQLVNSILQHELQHGVHALSLVVSRKLCSLLYCAVLYSQPS